MNMDTSLVGTFKMADSRLRLLDVDMPHFEEVSL